MMRDEYEMLGTFGDLSRLYSRNAQYLGIMCIEYMKNVQILLPSKQYKMPPYIT